MTMFVSLAMVVWGASAVPARSSTPDMMEFIVQSVGDGLVRDAVPQELAKKLADNESDFVSNCILCKAIREALHVYANRHVGPGPCKLSKKTMLDLVSQDSTVRQAALRDLVSSYIDYGLSNTKMTLAERKSLQVQMEEERKRSMGIKPKEMAYCPSCDGICCQAAPDEAVPFGFAIGGVQSRLSLITKRPQVGKPLRVRLELKNVGSLPITYDSQQAAVNNSLDVKGPDNNPVSYVATSFQTMGSPKQIQPGDTTVIITDLNVAEQYLVDKPGKYVIKSVARGGIPASNELQVEVAAGTPKDIDRLLMDMRSIAPQGWRTVRYENRMEPGIGSISFLNTPTRLKADATSISLYFTKEKKSGIEEQQVQPKYLGETIFGHAWLQQQSEVATERWPDHEKAIAEKLNPYVKLKW